MKKEVKSFLMVIQRKSKPLLFRRRTRFARLFALTHKNKGLFQTNTFKYKWTIVFLILILFIVLILGFYFFNGFEDSLKECEKDSDCVITETRCCPCNSGGEDMCVSKSERESYIEELKDCSENLLCAQVFSCSVESCGCINGECVG